MCFQVELFQSESVVCQSRQTRCDPWTVTHQAPLSVEFSRQEHWCGLPFAPETYKSGMWVPSGSARTGVSSVPKFNGKILGIQISMYLEVSGSRKCHECLYNVLTLMDLLSKI